MNSSYRAAVRQAFADTKIKGEEWREVEFELPAPKLHGLIVSALGQEYGSESLGYLVQYMEEGDSFKEAVGKVVAYSVLDRESRLALMAGNNPARLVPAIAQQLKANLDIADASFFVECLAAGISIADAFGETVCSSLLNWWLLRDEEVNSLKQCLEHIRLASPSVVEGAAGPSAGSLT